jgi:hypothetical protein
MAASRTAWAGLVRLGVEWEDAWYGADLRERVQKLMAKTNLLNTKTVNYLDLLGNGKLHRVPPYQRDYSWREEHWEDLWNDLMDLQGDDDGRHYMGALVVEAQSDREFNIIDGQQRIATLSILSLAILARLEELADSGIESESNRERIIELRKRYIGEKDPASLVERTKLRLNENDDGFYQDYLVRLRRPNNPRGLPHSNGLLWHCFEYYRSHIQTAPALTSNGRALALLLDETIARKLLFIHISVDDELSAYTVFETLNARGLELSATDLIKNLLFSRCKAPSDLEALQRRWRTLILTVRQERFPEFLRYHLLCSYPKIRTQRLFKLVSEQVRHPEDVFQLMDALEARAELFTALSDPNHDYWIERAGCRTHVRLLSMFRVRQMTPLLFAAWEKFTPENFERVLKLVTVIAFRYTVVGSLNTNELEPVYHTAAKSVLQGMASGPAAVFRDLAKIYVSDETFERDFEQLKLPTHGPRKRIVKYILCTLEADATGRACDFDTDPGSIEHILPENPGADWTGMEDSDWHDSALYQLGNLTLLESSLNRKVGNSGYDAKRAVYSESRYAQTAGIPVMAPEDWTLAHIKKRQREMADRAVHLWRSDFA